MPPAGSAFRNRVLTFIDITDRLVGDGVTDNTPLIQAALDELNAEGGGNIKIGPGTYLLGWNNTTVATWEGRLRKTALKIYSNITLDCRGATFILGNRADCLMATNSDWANGNVNIEIIGGTWNGAYWRQFQNADNFAGGGTSPYWNGHGLEFVNVDRLRTSHMKVVSHTKYGIFRQGCTRWWAENNDFGTVSDCDHVGGPTFMGTISGQTGYSHYVNWKIGASGGSGTFVRGELITQAGTGATAYYLSESGGFVYAERVSGTFNASGAISGATATRNVSSITFQTGGDNNVAIVSDEDEIYYYNDAQPWIRLTVAGTTGRFEFGETVTQATSGATGIFRFECLEDGYLYVSGVSGTFNGANNITGVTATRTVSAVAQAARPVNSILVKDVQIAPTGTFQPFRITGHAEDIISDVTYQNIKGKVISGDGFTFGDDASGGADLVGSIQKRIKCIDIALDVPTGSNVFNISGSGVKSVDIDGLKLVNPKANGVYCNNGGAGGSLVMDSLSIRNVATNGTDRAVFTIVTGATVNKLSVHNVEGVMSNDAGSNAGTVIGVTGTVGDLQHSNWNITSTVTGAVKGIVINAGTINSVVGSNTSMSGPNVNFLEYASTGTITKFGSWTNTIWTLTETTTGKHVVMVSGTPTQRLSFNNITLTGTSSTNLSYGWQIDSTNAQYLNVSNLTATGAWLYTFSVGGTAGLLVSNVSNWFSYDTTGLKAQNNSTVRMNVTGYYQSATGTGFDCGAGGGTLTTVKLGLTNAVFAGSNNLLKAQVKSNVVVNLNGLEMPTGTTGTGFLAAATNPNTADLTIRGGGAVTVTAGTLITRQTDTVSGIVRINHPQFPIAASIVTGALGDVLTSSNASGGLASAGLAVCNLAGAPATATWEKWGRTY